MKGLLASLRRMRAIALKESVQMRRDRLTFGMMFGLPVMQLILFGFAINLDPKQLPAALLLEESTPLVRTLVTGLATSDYYRFTTHSASHQQSDVLLASGEVAFVVTVPAGFTRSLLRGERPQLLIEADASDPAAASNALNRAPQILRQALAPELTGALAHLAGKPDPFELIVHPRYNPEGKTSHNIVPGLLGVILTMTLVMMTGMAMTREVERGNLENLLAMPARPQEVMLGKITPYVLVGATQTLVVLLAADWLFTVPFAGNLGLLLLGVLIFTLANLTLGFTFSTVAQSQLQAMQLTMFFFLPSILLSGFMFPFRGMPIWAQWLGEALPLTHFLRIIRGIMLKDASFAQLYTPFLALIAFTAAVMIIAMLRYRRTLD